ncbi:hypothetical protein [Lewinella sp. W8]|uniref:hypothetical protein n=1 Tax=Lewinella sp. W8 TaxID=2528208 RepID=UPI0010677F53|nr:hypothetical protein [Lewinella sp. W8]MTB50461.1 hypothetical protein [Lewinella sp. W8]
MRLVRTLFFLIVFGTTLQAQSLADLEPTAEMASIMEALEETMTASNNKTAKEAFVNFNGLFYGGAFTEEQQQVIGQTVISLAKKRISPSSGFVAYLGALAGMTSTDGTEGKRFQEFHDGFAQLMATPKVRVNTIVSTLSAVNTFLNTNRLDAGGSGSGWLVKGGKPGFRFEDGLRMTVDSIETLVGMGKDDSIRITETRLDVDLAEGMAYGRGGRTDWQKQGLPEEVFAILVSYHLDVRRTLYTADSAHLQYPEYFGDEILVGSFTDKVQPGGARSGAEYPQFLSDDGYVEIKNVGEGIDLAGNFELRGSTVYAIGDDERKAKVTLRIQDQIHGQTVRGMAKRFTVRQGERIGGQGVETTIYVGKDSIYHPSVTMKVDIPEGVVSLTRTESSADQSPFYHSQNNLNLYADHLDIYLQADSAVVGKKTVSFQEKSDVVFESKDYFSTSEYLRIRDIARSNPLDLIYAFRNGPEGGNDIIDADRLAQVFNRSFRAEDIAPLLFDLQTKGFLLYNVDEQLVELLPKVGHYVESSREEKDYDRLRLISRTKDINAYFDLKNGQVVIENVLPIEFNRRKQIAIKPLGSQVILSGDRDFDFSGQLFAGGMVFEGKNFQFKYAPYYVKMDSVRYFDLFLPEGDVIGEGMTRVSTGSRIEHLNGYLLIDAPKNKSGTEDIPYFPSLQTKGTSYIFYDQADTNSIYARDSFYFELAPFSLNGLDSLTAPEVELGGKLVSGGIFPDMEEVLSIQEDGSLGFITETDENGQDTYGDRGNYRGEVILSNRGLEGKGRLSYLEAEIESEDLKFTPEQTTASARQFDLEETNTAEREVPQVRGREVNITFKPYGDSLLVQSVGEEAFDLFQQGEHTFNGELVLTPEALKGNGKLGWSAADMSSKDMDFGVYSAMADTADVNIKSLEADDRLALSTTNVRADIDFEKQLASFQNNSTDLATIMPYNQFKTSINRFDWDMAGGNITFQAEIGKDRFTSIHPDQDSLTFTGTAATYDINTSMLNVEGVPFVKSADAMIYPGDEKIRVEPGAQITELTDARIVADTVNQYHVINRATVRIKGRKEYNASGFYEYNVGPHTQEFELQNIVGARIGKGKRNEKATATRAEGEIAEGSTFYVDDKTKFYGEINLDSGSESLFFDGYAKIEAESLPGAQWFTVRSEGDKKNLTLDISSPKDRDGLPLFTGFYLSKPYRQIYPSMVQTKDQRKDHAILDANGVFTYNQAQDKFYFGDSARVKNPALVGGNLMVLDNAAKKVSGNGMLGIGGRLKYVSMTSYGDVEMDMPTESRREPEPEPVAAPEAKKEEEEAPSMFLLEEEVKPQPDTTAATAEEGVKLTIDGPVGAAYPEVLVKAMTAIDLIIPDKLINLMVTDIKSASFASPGLNLVTDGDFYRAGLQSLFPASRERDAAIAGLSAGTIDVPKQINRHTFLLSQLKLKWSSDYQSFVSTDKLTGVASIKSNPINKMLEVHVEVKMTTGGEDRVYIYVKSPSELYYFYGFRDGILNVVSNNTQFMSELDNMKANELVLKMDDGETYEILPVSPGTAQTFLRRVQNAFGKK